MNIIFIVKSKLSSIERTLLTSAIRDFNLEQ